MEKKVLNYRIIIEPEKYPNGSKAYNAYCPTLGVADYGDSVEEVLKSIKDGIKLAIDHLIETKKEVPVDYLDEQIITSTKVDAPFGMKIAIN